MKKTGASDAKMRGAANDGAPSDALPPRPGSYTAEELAELERRDRLSGWLLLFFTGAALATAALAFYLFSEDFEQKDEYVRIEREETGEMDDTPFNWGQAPDESAAEPTEGTTGGERAVAGARPMPRPLPETSVAETEEAEPDTSVSSPQPAAPTFAGPPAGSVDRETARALRSGKAQLWREQGQRGYVLVSGAVTYGTRECRQVSYTRFEQGRQATSPSAQWCRTTGSTKWRPDPRGPE
ncbi:hypothetical protein K3152_10110 [Qipengyuania sp. 1NDH17]|uniref:SPOR domain-containing protein n=1 Tax=Qipengyuania polymorpha TaxID=2867234 RepID=A0ABS7IYG2_9SPHN|nr:hypothetical protein [Qipengyuania polymorpha]MBX7458598.1 hypothetical protein [Qipengyuania polymorpha]